MAKRTALIMRRIWADLEVGDCLSNAILRHTEVLQRTIIFYHKDGFLQTAVLQPKLQNRCFILDILLPWYLFVPPNLFFPPWPADLLVWESSIRTAVNQVIHPLPLHDVVQHQLPPHRLLPPHPWQNITEVTIMIWLFMALHILCS